MSSVDERLKQEMCRELTDVGQAAGVKEADGVVRFKSFAAAVSSAC